MIFLILVGLLATASIETTFAKFEAESLTRRALSDPKSIGGIHTAAFEKLSQKYAAQMENSSDAETASVSADTALQDMTEVMYDFCRDGDTKCTSSADDAMAVAMETIMGGNPGEISIEYPADMHVSLTTLLDQMFDTVLQLDEDNLETVVASLMDIETQMEEAEGATNPFHNYIARAASSVAVETTQMWHSVFTNPDHPLHPLISASDGNDGSASEEADGRILQLLQIGVIAAGDVAGFFLPIAGSLIPTVLTFLPVLIPILGLLWIPIGVVIFFFGSILTLLMSAFSAIAFSTVGVIVSIPITIIQIIGGGDDDSSSNTTNVFNHDMDDLP